MSQEIDLGGTIYISSRRAADITGYTQDYIGQLARAGHIDARRVAGLWYVKEESLRDHKQKADEFKPTPPQRVSEKDIEASVSFDGKDYISATRAARITGYSQDYVGQLARSEKILSRQIGNRWYVDREGIISHKKHNDSLLAAVQTDSVGLHKPELSELDQNGAQDDGNSEPLYNYFSEPVAVVPEIEPKQVEKPLDDVEELPGSAAENDSVDVETMADSTQQIPIRVVQPAIAKKNNHKLRQQQAPKKSSAPRIAIFLLVFLVVAGGTTYALLYRERASINVPTNPSNVTKSTNLDAASSALAVSRSYISQMALTFLAKELYYSK